MQIRPMNTSDLSQVAELEKRQHKPWPQYAFDQAMRLGHSCMVVDIGGDIIGYGVCDKGHGRTINATNAKAAILLYKNWHDIATQAGAQILYAETHRDSVEAIAMLMRFGFTKQGLRPSFYGPGEDAVVWSRPNLAGAGIILQELPESQVVEAG